MATTYEFIASSTVGSGGVSSIEFTSISGTYTDLVLVISGRLTGNLSYQGTIQITVNNSTSSYSRRYLYAEGTTPSIGSGAVTSGTILGSIVTSTSGSGQTASTFNNGMIYIQNYTSSNYKSASFDSVAENNSETSGMGIAGALWSNTDAITSIKLTPESGYGNLAQYTTAYLYGIKNS